MGATFFGPFKRSDTINLSSFIDDKHRAKTDSPVKMYRSKSECNELELDTKATFQIK